MTRAGDISAAEIKQQLHARMLDLARELAPVQGHIEGQDWVALNPTRADRRAGSFRIQIAGHMIGFWTDFATGDGGDVIDLISYIEIARGRGYKDKRQIGLAFGWAKRWLGIDGKTFTESERAARAKRAADAARRGEAKAAADATRKVAQAQGLWLGARASIEDTPAETYLAHARGIDFAALGRYPGALRYAPAMLDPWQRCAWPAMLGCIVGPDGQGGERIQGLHRTFLRAVGATISKAPLPDNARASLGRVKGGTIRLWRGASGKRWRDAAKGETLVLTEGIEDGLSVAIARPDLRVAAAVSLGNLAALDLPRHFGDIVIVADNDTGTQARAALDKAVARFQRQGFTVKVARSGLGKDANDLLRGARERGAVPLRGEAAATERQA